MEYIFSIRIRYTIFFTINLELDLGIKVVQRNQEKLEYFSAVLHGLKDVEKETAMNYPSETVMKKEITGQCYICMSRHRKGFQILNFRNHFHFTCWRKKKNPLLSHLCSLEMWIPRIALLFFEAQVQWWECQTTNTEFDWHCQAAIEVQRWAKESSEIKSWVMLRSWILQSS